MISSITHAMIDMVQKTNKQAVSAFISDSKVSAALNHIVDIQADIAREAFDTGLTAITTVSTMLPDCASLWKTRKWI